MKSSVPPCFSSALLLSKYLTTEHSQGFFTCFMMKSLLIFQTFGCIFKPNFIFQTVKSGISLHLFSDKARQNKPTTTLVKIDVKYI